MTEEDFIKGVGRLAGCDMTPSNPDRLIDAIFPSMQFTSHKFVKELLAKYAKTKNTWHIKVLYSTGKKEAWEEAKTSTALELMKRVWKTKPGVVRMRVDTELGRLAGNFVNATVWRPNQLTHVLLWDSESVVGDVLSKYPDACKIVTPRVGDAFPLCIWSKE